MGVFDGIDKAPMPGGGNYIQPGKYLFEVQKCVQGESQKGDGAFVAVELTVIEVLVEKPGSNDVGETVSWVVMFKHAPAMSNVKGFLGAVLELAPDEIDATVAEEATAGAGDSLQGARVVGQASMTKTRAGNDFTKLTWESEGG